MGYEFVNECEGEMISKKCISLLIRVPGGGFNNFFVHPKACGEMIQLDAHVF